MEQVKIKKATVTNCKNVSYFSFFPDGKSGHVVGENGEGKSTVITALTDAAKALYPDTITKIGEKEGEYVLELTSGGKFTWNYNTQGKNILNYYEPNKFKPVSRASLKTICKALFPTQFDINKFLTTTENAKRLKMISELIGVDLSEVKGRYNIAFDERKEAKKALRHLEEQEIIKPDLQKFDFEDFAKNEQAVSDERTNDITIKKADIKTERTRLNNLYATNKEVNDNKEKKHKQKFNIDLGLWMSREKARIRAVSDFNETQEEIEHLITVACEKYTNIAFGVKGLFLAKYFDMKGAQKELYSYPKPSKLITYESPKQPELKPLSPEELPDPMPCKKALEAMELKQTELEIELTEATEKLNTKNLELAGLKADKTEYDKNVLAYDNHLLAIDKDKETVQEHEVKVQEIKDEIKTIVSNTKIPDNFQIDLDSKNDILFRTSPDAEYMPITTETLASSAIHIAAFELACNYIGLFMSLHFDVSYLSFTNRAKIVEYANKMGVQVITESAAQRKEDIDLKFIPYQIVEDLEK